MPISNAKPGYFQPFDLPAFIKIISEARPNQRPFSNRNLSNESLRPEGSSKQVNKFQRSFYGVIISKHVYWKQMGKINRNRKV